MLRENVKEYEVVIGVGEKLLCRSDSLLLKAYFNMKMYCLDNENWKKAILYIQKILYVLNCKYFFGLCGVFFLLVWNFVCFIFIFFWKN